MHFFFETVGDPDRLVGCKFSTPAAPMQRLDDTFHSIDWIRCQNRNRSRLITSRPSVNKQKQILGGVLCLFLGGNEIKEGKGRDGKGIPNLLLGCDPATYS